MKIKNLELLGIASLLLLIVLFSCNEPEKKISSINITETYTADTVKSNVTWSRYLERGKTTTKMKLFGGEANITIDGLKLNTDGDVDIVKGEIIKFNDSLISGNIIFDFRTLSLNTDRRTKEEDLFKVKQFPESAFKIMKFTKDSAGYNLLSELSIADVTKELNSFAQIIQSNDSLIQLTGEFEIQTLDWPLRDEKQEKSVIKDVITVNMNLFFKQADIQRDTIYIVE